MATIPPGATLPPGFTIPPGLEGNGTEGGLLDTDFDGGGGLGDFAALGDVFNATPVFLDDKFEDYDRASATAAMAGIPRFGHTNDISRLAYLSSSDGKQADGEDYIMGLLFAGCFLLVFFLIWSIVLVIFKLFLNGFLRGDPFLNPWIDDPAETKRKEEIEEDGDEYVEDKSWMKRPFRIRITFFICGLIQIIFALLMVTKGVANLQETTDTVQISTSNLQLLLNEAVQVSENLKQVGETGSILRDQVVFDLDRDNFCPDNPIFDQTQTGKDLLWAAEGAVSVLDQMGNFIGENVATLEEGLKDAQRNLKDIDKSIERAEGNEWLGGLVAFPYLVLSSLMMVGAVAAQLGAMTECFLCVLNWLILPIFIFVTFVSYLFLGLLSIAASANADFCGGESSTPDQVIMDIMFRSGFEQDDMFFQIVRYYANQCTSAAVTDPFLFIRSFDGSLIQGRELVQNLTDSMDGETLDQLSLGCNRDFRPLHRSLGQMVGVLDALLQSSSRALNLLRCSRVVPFYTDIVYDATCTYSVSGFSWLFSSLLIVSVMGMIMIMFRSSYQNTIFDRAPALMDDSSDDDHRSIGSRKSRDSGADRWNDEQ